MQVAQRMKNGRTAFACFREYQRLGSKGVARRPWTDKDENARLVALYHELGPKWKAIARRLGGGAPPLPRSARRFRFV